MSFYHSCEDHLLHNLKFNFYYIIEREEPGFKTRALTMVRILLIILNSDLDL